jgi:hypothetical protein
VIGLSIAFAIRQWRRAGLALLLYMAVPLALILGLTLLVTPIYHVRYLSFVAAPFVLVSASAVVDLWGWRRGAGAALAGLLLLVMSASLAAFWTNPRYAADDHRGAVAALAARWRPGDVFWPTPAGSTRCCLPIGPTRARRQRRRQSSRSRAWVRRSPPARSHHRAHGERGRRPGTGLGQSGQRLLCAGCSAATVAGLASLAATHPRLWHYRLYDTVSDPDGLILGRGSQTTPICAASGRSPGAITASSSCTPAAA